LYKNIWTVNERCQQRAAPEKKRSRKRRECISLLINGITEGVVGITN
jgi:hypothetical protein|tara:strand:+ start:298 stop:438 length:141 start_codon:yes stop_codon:yes gene_type:complete